MIAKIKAVDWKAAGWATLIVLAAIGAACVAAFFGTNPKWWYFFPGFGGALAWYCAYLLSAAVRARRADRPRRAQQQARQERDAAALESNWGVPPPKPGAKSWLLTEGGVPVAVETNKRAAENWMGMGPDCDAIPQPARPAARLRVRADEASRVRRARKSGRAPEFEFDDRMEG